MSETEPQKGEIELAEPEQAIDLLNEREKRVALWLASPITERNAREITAVELAEELGCDRTTVFRTASRENVRKAAAELANRALSYDTVPALWGTVLQKASEDAELALRVLDKLASLGIDVIMGEGTVPGAKSKPSRGVTVTVPGGYDAMVRAERRD